MTPIQWVLVASFISAAILYFYLFRSVLADRVIVISAVALATAAACYPAATTWVANLLGVGRGTDLILYGLCVIFAFVLIIVYSRLAQLNRLLTALVRDLAIQRPIAVGSPGPGDIAKGHIGTEPSESRERSRQTSRRIDVMVSEGASAAWRARALGALQMACNALLLAALSILAWRACTRLDGAWDTLSYHLAFAAHRTGVPISFDLEPDGMLLWYQGFPPLADWVQGLLWRLTGSVTLAGAANLIGLIVFLFVVKQIGGHPGIAGIVCLTTPLIVIHTTLCYIDLLSNSFLAVSLVSLGHAMLYRNYSSQPLLLTIVGAAVLAAWSKMLMVPLTIASLLLLLALVLVDEPRKAIRRRITSAVVCGLIAAAAPYLHNLARYGNPIWPLRAPLIGRHLPFAMAPVNYDRPAHLVGTSQPELFVRSLLETENPSEYPNRSRWTADQGATSAAHRMGGYWWVSVVTALIVLPTVAIAAHGRRGVRLIAALAAVLGVCALLPQAHELRYYQFIPLTWAGVIGCALPRFGHARPGCALMIVCLLVLEFCASTWMNKEYYDTQPVTLEAIAKARGLKDWWGRLSPGRKYYAVGMEPAAILLAGPTLREFRIEESSDPILCPPDAEIVYRGRVGKASTFVSVQEATKSGEKLLARGYVRLAERICRAVLHKDDSHYDATTLLARVLDTAEKRIEAKSVWRAALRMAQQRGDSSMERICRDKLASDQ